MDQMNSYKECTTCSICDTGHGLFVHQPCTSVSNTVCGVLNGYFCTRFTDNGGCSLAFRHTVCAPGQQMKQAGTNRTDTVCEDCQSGFFSLDGVNCTAWKVCEETETVVKEGSSSQDVICERSAGRIHHATLASFLLLVVVVVVVSLIIKGRTQEKCRPFARNTGSARQVTHVCSHLGHQ
ncbi:tumor necrosis factor receptor superfamily member 14-like isoform X1 [Thalassophryne amazonica]|uniref:tumor necrosis factor receptor superfamily member 14-like isoform X1 n=1 Tax=Thalassophryne amazonica TaxID=390379 RepID=UPI001471768E|nr:tumor necrosis factor receptor superfamily member 14-like isoform X1 [Thalassophryne amazonica]